MLAFYSIRKLVEAKKLSSTVAERRSSVVTYRWLGKPVTHLNWHRIDDLYDTKNPVVDDRTLIALCNQFIHSFIFAPTFDDAGLLDGVMFASDRQRTTALLHIKVEEVIATLRIVGNDYPTSARFTFNQKKGDYDVVSTA